MPSTGVRMATWCGKKELSLGVDAYIRKTGSTYLFSSVTFQLLEILVWYKQYIDETNGMERNSFWMEKPIETITEYAPNRFCCGPYEIKFLPKWIYKSGDKVRVLKWKKNKNNTYPYFIDDAWKDIKKR